MDKKYLILLAIIIVIIILIVVYYPGKNVKKSADDKVCLLYENVLYHPQTDTPFVLIDLEQTLNGKLQINNAGRKKFILKLGSGMVCNLRVNYFTNVYSRTIVGPISCEWIILDKIFTNKPDNLDLELDIKIHKK